MLRVARILKASASFAGDYFDRQDSGLDKVKEYAEPIVKALGSVFKGMRYDSYTGYLTVSEQHSPEEWTELFNKVPGYEVRAYPGFGEPDDAPPRVWLGWSGGYKRFEAHLLSSGLQIGM